MKGGFIMKVLLSIIGVLAFIAVLCVVVSIAKAIVRFLIKAFIIVYGGALIIGCGASIPEYIKNKVSPEVKQEETIKKTTTKKKKTKKVKAKKTKNKKVTIKKEK